MNLSQAYPAIAAQVAEAMQQLGNIPEQLPEQLQEAAIHIASQFTREQKLMVLGTDGVRFLGEMLCYNLLTRHHQYQPGLPALALPRLNLDLPPLNAEQLHDPNSVSQSPDSSAHAIAPDFKLMLRSAETLGEKGDVLLFLSDRHIPGLATALSRLYQARGISCLYLGPQIPEAQLLSGHSIYLPLVTESQPRMHEMILFILNNLNAMIQSLVFNGHFEQN